MKWPASNRLRKGWVMTGVSADWRHAKISDPNGRAYWVQLPGLIRRAVDLAREVELCMLRIEVQQRINRAQMIKYRPYST